MRLLDPMDTRGRFPFPYTSSTRTDVRATWDRLVPGWRDRPVSHRVVPGDGYTLEAPKGGCVFRDVKFINTRR